MLQLLASKKNGKLTAVVNGVTHEVVVENEQPQPKSKGDSSTSNK